MKALRAFALAALAICPEPAHALFIAREMDHIDTEGLFDTEYFLDLRSFSYPLDWDLFWNIASRTPRAGYRINGASLDRTDLLIQQEGRMAKALEDWLVFEYRLDHYGDKDLLELHQTILLDFGPFKGFTFGLFGEPTFDKEDADIGAKIGYRPSDVWNIYASALAVDFNFNDRGKSGASYDTKPITYAFGADAPLAGGRLSSRVEIDAPLMRRIPASNRVYGYSRKRASVSWLLPPSEQGGWHWLLGYAYDFKRETDDFEPDASRLSQDFHRQAHSLRAAGLSEVTELDTLEAGLEGLSRTAAAAFENNRASELRYQRWELQPYARWRRHVKDWAIAEAATFLSFGDKRRRYASTTAFNDSVVEAKLGLGWDFVFARGGRIGLYGTFDLDDLAAHAWDGGNLRAMLLF